MERHHPSSFLMVLHVSLCLFFCFFAAEGEVKSLSVDFTHDEFLGRDIWVFEKERRQFVKDTFFPSKDVNVFTMGIFFNDGTEEHYVSYGRYGGWGGVGWGG